MSVTCCVPNPAPSAPLVSVQSRWTGQCILSAPPHPLGAPTSHSGTAQKCGKVHVPSNNSPQMGGGGWGWLINISAARSLEGKPPCAFYVILNGFPEGSSPIVPTAITSSILHLSKFPCLVFLAPSLCLPETPSKEITWSKSLSQALLSGGPISRHGLKIWEGFLEEEVNFEAWRLTRRPNSSKSQRL